MSATQTKPKDQSETDTEVPDCYEEISRYYLDFQADVARAWAEGKFPPHNTSPTGAGILRSSDNFKGIQYPDGTGKLKHYRTREAIRTRSGLTINNSQCWSKGFAHCSPAPGAHARLPLSAIERHLDSETDVFDIRRVQSEEDPRTGAFGRWKIVSFEGAGYHVGIGRDASHIGTGGRFTVALPEFFAAYAAEDGESVVETIRAFIRPTKVTRSKFDVVNSHEYRRTDLSDDELKAHREAGGPVHEMDTWRGTKKVNRSYYRADLRGSVIVRQGRMFYIPRHGFDPSDRSGQHTRYVLPRYFKLKGDGFEAEDGTLYVRGRIGHSKNDFNMIDLGETWHQVARSEVDAPYF